MFSATRFCNRSAYTINLVMYLLLHYEYHWIYYLFFNIDIFPNRLLKARKIIYFNGLKIVSYLWLQPLINVSFTTNLSFKTFIIFAERRFVWTVFPLFDASSLPRNLKFPPWPKAECLRQFMNCNSIFLLRKISYFKRNLISQRNKTKMFERGSVSKTRSQYQFYSRLVLMSIFVILFIVLSAYH